MTQPPEICPVCGATPNADLRAEVERLRAGLDKIASDDPFLQWDQMREIARQLLRVEGDAP